MACPRVIIFHPALAPYRIDIFNSLAEKCDLKVVFLRRNLMNQKFDQDNLCKQLKCQYEHLVNGFNIKNYSFRFGVKKIIEDYKPDIVITHEYSVQSVLLSFKSQFSCFWSKRNIKFLIWTSDNVPIFKNCNFLRRIARWGCLRNVDGVLTYIGDIKKCYVDYGIAEDRIGIFPNIQDGESVRKKILSGHEFAIKYIKKYALNNKKVILFVGRLVEIKNLPFFLRAFSQVCDDDTSLVLVGDGEMDDELKVLTEELNIADKVIFPGRFDGKELYAWYFIGKLFVLPSLSETFGAVVNEALAAGMPCLVSNATGVANIMTEEKQGAIFDPENIEELKQLLDEKIQSIPLLQTEKLELPTSLLTSSLDDVTDDLIDFFKHLKEK